MRAAAQRECDPAAEMQHAAQFDFVIINEVFERALQEMQTIIAAQRLRYSSQREARADVFKSLGIF